VPAARHHREQTNGQTRELLLATHDTPDALSWRGRRKAERRRIAVERESAPPTTSARIFASIRKVFGVR